MKMKKEDIIPGSIKFSSSVITTPKKDHEVSVRVGNKVLPVNESTTTTSSCSSSSSSKNLNPNLSFDLKKENGRDYKMKTVSRMRELLRWAAAAKSEKGGKYIARKVAQFRNRNTTLKMTQDDDQLTNDSPKISFRWEIESCSTFSSALSASSTNHKNDQNVNIEIHSNPDGNSSYASLRSGSWITSDSDFVVLEL